MKKFFLSVLAALLVGCTTNESPETLKTDFSSLEEIENYELLIDSKSRTLESSDASKVAMLFQARENKNSRSDESLVAPQIETIYDEDTETPLLYIVNWPNGGGFAIVSASKMTAPYSLTQIWVTSLSKQILPLTHC